MTPPGFDDIAGLLRRRTGIALSADKTYLLDTRLRPVLAKFGLPSLAALGMALRGEPEERLARCVVEALTTHESSFFRDGFPFDHLRGALSRMMAAKPAGERLRIWSAGCSTGQEAYSVAMLATDVLGAEAARRVEIVGTDISRKVLFRARQGVFSAFEVRRGLGACELSRHFTADAAGWRVKPALLAMARFEEGNLLEPNAALGRFDAVFCRNVLIYFDAPTKARVLDALARRLGAGGVLYLGAAETMIGLSARLVPLTDARGAFTARDARIAA
jgi:chemotaxis protein methyltransferase CheR